MNGETITVATQDYTVTSSNDGSVSGHKEVPEKHKRAVKNAVVSSIHHSPTGDNMFIDVHSGLVSEENKPQKEWDIAVTIKTSNQSISNVTISEIEEEINQTSEFETLSISIQSVARDVELNQC